MNNKDKSISHQVIGSNVVKISTILGLIFWSKDKIETKFPWNKGGVNLTISVRFGFITQWSIQISDFLIKLS